MAVGIGRDVKNAVNAPLSVVVVADGEDALRLAKRVQCASRALDLGLVIESRAGAGGTPRILIDDDLIAEGLPRTEEIEARIADWLAQHHTKERSMHPPRVLFVCDGGSARSRMAEGLLRNLAGDRFEVDSAGIETEVLNPLARDVMREIGIEMAAGPIPALNDFEDTRFDYLIALCDEARESCLSFPRDAHNLHWSCTDPSLVQGTESERLAAFRECRGAIKEQLQTWLDTLDMA